MRIVMRGAVAVCAIAGFALAASGQISGGVGSGSGGGARTAAGPHPYTAQFRITSEQTLANGTTITRESTETQAVDSQGRQLSVVTTQATGQSPESSTYHVYDPVTGTNTNWTSMNKVATVQKMPPVHPKPGGTCWGTGEIVSSVVTSGQVGIGAVAGQVIHEDAQLIPRRSATNETKTEKLGTQTFQGVEATGTRTTVTTPTGAIGNSAPLVRTTESWRALSLGELVVRSVHEDPETGKRMTELTELNQTEPDPALFQVPEGYTINTVEFHEIPCGR